MIHKVPWMQICMLMQSARAYHMTMPTCTYTAGSLPRHEVLRTHLGDVLQLDGSGPYPGAALNQTRHPELAPRGVSGVASWVCSPMSQRGTCFGRYSCHEWPDTAEGARVVAGPRQPPRTRMCLSLQILRLFCSTSALRAHSTQRKRPLSLQR